MKLNVLIQSQVALANLLQLKLPMKTAYKISKLISKIHPEVRLYEEQRVKLVKELGYEIEGKKDQYQVHDENVPQFQEKMNELGDVEVSIDFAPDKPFEKIKLAELGNSEIQAQDLFILQWLIEE